MTGQATAPRVHLIGVCGTGMATLAAMLKARGYDVQGSDAGVYPPMSDFLAREGVRVFDGYAEAQITGDLDLVIIGNAISRGNPELEAVLDRRLPYQSFPEAVRDEFLWQARSYVIAGTHGKTTTTALAGWLLTAGGCDPTVLTGGIALNFEGSYRLGAGGHAVIEGDEYDSAFFDKTAKFLKYRPDVAVVANLEYDHADIYPDFDSLRLAFRRLVNLIPRSGLLLLGAGSAEALALAGAAPCPVETFGLEPDADWQATDIAPIDGGVGFDVRRRGEPFGRFTSPLPGLHNVRNALAAVAVGRAAGLEAPALQAGLAAFKGVRRRLERRGEIRGVTVFDDFAHHPTAILETLQAVRWSHPDRRIWAVFEPRSATSCRRIFQDDFARAFVTSGADEVVLAPVFRDTIPEPDRLSVPALVSAVSAAGPRARALGGVDEIVETIAGEAQAGDLVVVMSNGGFGGIHQRLLDALGGAGGDADPQGAAAPGARP